jgi:hypothetical protein
VIIWLYVLFFSVWFQHLFFFLFIHSHVHTLGHFSTLPPLSSPLPPVICSLKKYLTSWALVTTPVILATQEAEIRRITLWSQPRTNSSWDPISKIPNTIKGWQNGAKKECLPRKREALSSNSVPQKNKTKQKQQKAYKKCLTNCWTAILHTYAVRYDILMCVTLQWAIRSDQGNWKIHQMQESTLILGDAGWPSTAFFQTVQLRRGLCVNDTLHTNRISYIKQVRQQI